MHKLDYCLICGSPKQQQLYQNNFRGTVKDAADFFLAQRIDVAHGSIVRCLECDFVYTNQQFDPTEYQCIYSEASKRLDSPDDFLEAEQARGRRLAKLVKRYATSGKLLDFGCGQGGFLNAVHGMEKTGFEIAPMPAHGRIDAEIITGDFLSFDDEHFFSSKSFDVVTAFDVLEHLPDIEDYLRKLTEITCKNGIFVVTVPNVESVSAKLWRGRWGLFLLEHLWYFSPRTLKTFIERFGWEMIGSGHVPYDVTLSHLAQRTSQLLGMSEKNRFNKLSNIVLPVPVGLMYAIFRKAR